MAQCVSGEANHRLRSLQAAGRRVIYWLWFTLLSACSALDPAPTGDLITPLQLPGRSVEVPEVAARVRSPDLLAMDQEMSDFVSRYTADLNRERQRLDSLHWAVKSSGILDMRYDPWADGGAIEAFHRGTANCLSYASLFVALAREAGLDAGYQWLDVRPQWSRMGERVAVRLHVNVVVDTRRGGQYMVDIDPLQAQDIAGSRRISDAEALALYHNNIAMNALEKGQLEEAWLQVVRALQLSPQMSLLWVNLGAVYRQSDQYDEAERSYQHALRLDPQERSAMTNLVVLYTIQGRTQESAHWESQIERYRESNPFFHAWLGEQAVEKDDWETALGHYERALRLSPDAGNLLYSTGLIHYQLQDLPTASRYLTKAIEAATLRRDRDRYQAQLDAL